MNSPYEVEHRMDFVAAIQKACDGEMITRLDWAMSSGDNVSFVFRQVPSNIGLEIVPKMTSLPEKVKTELLLRRKELQYQNQFAYVTDSEESSSISGWRPNQEDKEAKDWVVLERDKTV